MNPHFWRGRRVFLTGHTGFKGSWLSLWLQELGAHVTGYSLAAPTEPSLFGLARVAEGMVSLTGDVRDAVALRQAMQAARPEIVIHMAAQALVRESYQDPITNYATNVMGTVHLLDAVRATEGVRAVLNVTSDKCYDNREWLWGYREGEALGGYDPYSSSKACAELVTSAYRSSFFPPDEHARHGVAVATARAGNVIGGGDWAAHRLVPDILHAFESAQPVHIRNPHAVRPWQHVLEPLRGYLMLSERLCVDGCAWAEAWNFGPHDTDAQPVSRVVQRLAQLWGEGATWLLDTTPQPHEAHHLRLDTAKARTRLGWQPLLGLDEALEHVVVWSRARQDGGDVRRQSVNQIQAYQARLGGA